MISEEKEFEEYQQGYNDGRKFSKIAKTSEDYTLGYRNGANRENIQMLISWILTSVLLTGVGYKAISEIRTERDQLKATQQKIVRVYRETGTLPQEVLRQDNLNVKGLEKEVKKEGK
jgi:hypothetical protein